MRILFAKTVLTLFTILIIETGLLGIVNTFASEYSYRGSGCIQALLNSTSDKLYVSHFEDNTIVEVDINTMLEIRSFDNISGPSMMALSPDGLYLYTISSDISTWPTEYLVRINLLNEQTDQLALNGEIMGFTLNDNGDSIWVIHRLYPEPDEYSTVNEAILDYPDSGFLTLIDISSFSVIRTISSSVLPMAVWYSDYSDKVYVSRETVLPISTEEGSPSGHVVFSWSGDLLQWKGYFLAGKHQTIFGVPTGGCDWSDDARYFVTPSSVPNISDFSLRVIDSVDNSVSFDLTFPNPNNGVPLNIKFVKKVPGEDILWCASHWGYPPDDPNRLRVVFRVNTATHDFEMFEISEATSPFAYFDVSNDGRTLYLTQPWEGSIIVTSPGNHAPVCDLLVITPRPHTGPSPVAVEFDASGTYDDDGDTLTFHWDFDGDKVFDEPIDDAYTGDPSNPTHEYTADYEGAVNLRVTDNYQGECDTAVILSVDVE